jgi:hypothetical protein
MPVSPQEAAEALHEIEVARSRSSTLRRYQLVAPHFFLWGAVWAIGYGATDLMPARGRLIWGVLLPIAVACGFFITRNRRGGNSGSNFAAVAATMATFLAATFAIMWPVAGRQVAAFIPLVVATSYVLVGIWLGLRFVVAGAVVAVATLGGFFLLSEHFALWMAVVGGGSLILAGIWFTKA